MLQISRHLCSPTASVSAALEEYENGFKGKTSIGSYCKPPRPPYMENNPGLYADLDDTADEDSMMMTEDGDAFESRDFIVRDMCYHLLKLYSDRGHRLERVLAPTTHSGYQLDYRLR